MQTISKHEQQEFISLNHLVSLTLFSHVLVSHTSALCPGVSPEVLLTVCACLPSKAITALTLTRELHDKKKYVTQALYSESIPTKKHKVFPTSLHAEVTELLGSQLHGSQPLPLATFQWLGAQWSHARPTTFCRHWHWPVARWHTQSSRSIHWLRSVPRKLHVHSEGKKKAN